MKDQPKADAILVEIASVIANTPAVSDSDEWSGITVVCEHSEGLRVFGLIYDEAGEEDCFLPDEIFDDLAYDFHDATLADGKPGWLCCLFQITRADMKINVRFEYDDPRRWSITPANRAEMVALLRP